MKRDMGDDMGDDMGEDMGIEDEGGEIDTEDRYRR